METQEEAVFDPLTQPDDLLASLLPRSVVPRLLRQAAELVTTPVVATLVEFALDDRPLIRSDSLLAGERLAARATVAIRRAQLGRSVVVLCENGDPRLPIIVGVLGDSHEQVPEAPPGKHAVIRADDERFIVDAEREIVLRCGESSITLTRAGKVIIKGKYVLSRSSGYNKIKGAAVDIN